MEIHQWVKTSLMTLQEIPTNELERTFGQAFQKAEKSGIPSDRALLAANKEIRSGMGGSYSSGGDIGRLPPEESQGVVEMMTRRLHSSLPYSKREMDEAERIVSRGWAGVPELNMERLEKLRREDAEDILNRPVANPEYEDAEDMTIRGYTDTLARKTSF